MRLGTCCLLMLTLSLPGNLVSTSDFLRFCYFYNTHFKSTTGPPFNVENIDLRLCTHFIYAHARINRANNSIVASNPALEEGPTGTYKRFVDSKLTTRAVKCMLSLGGPSESSEAFDDITKTDASMKSFAATAVIFLRDHGFDGLDIDWQYPDSESRKDKLSKLLKALRKAFNNKLKEFVLLLTLAGPGIRSQIDAGYDIQEIAIYVDYVFIKAYKLVMPDTNVATFSSALFHNPHSAVDATLNVNYSVHYWNDQGLPYSKIVVGLTGEGRYLKLKDWSMFKPGAPVLSEVLRGDYYNITSGMLYPQICESLRKNPKERYYDYFQLNPYFVHKDIWVGYEDKESLGTKLQWMVNHKVAGFMFAGLHEDDFAELCSNGKFPLLSSLYNRILDMFSDKHFTTEAPTTLQDPFQPAKGPTSNSVLAYLAFVFILAGSITGYGLCLFIVKHPATLSFSE